jgi:predicted transposase YdaD
MGQSHLAVSTGFLAERLLKSEFINQILPREIMHQSAICQEQREKFLQEGKTEGIIEGRIEEARRLIQRQLARRVGNLPASVETQVQAQNLAQLEALSEALLDFTQLFDLTNWLRAQV